MKKCIALSVLFAFSSVAFAQVANDPNNALATSVGETSPANVQILPKMPHPWMADHWAKQRKFHAMPHFTHFDKPAKKREFKPSFFDESQAVKNVKEIANAKNKAFVMMEGNIIKQVGKKEFLFKDATGEVEIEVSRRAWGTQTITPNDTVEIRGIVDKAWEKTEIEIKQIIKK